ncbi:hypothetical protein Acr_00g0055170 [Actinidia rufa]|uniref:Uncharacterized protein n=1 Tax=Actinidia rufa TaxID=165716 RepID=A0A7J0DM27_9ERIC|nr:hypothetical protein Acr_00g0055170 [Actinidia rufa]
MELNRSQLLVYDDAALDKFRLTTAFLRINFPTVPKICCTSIQRAVVEEGVEHTLPERWEFRAMDDGLWSILRHHGRLLDNFNDLFKRQSKEYKKVIQAVNNRQALRKVIDLLAYEPIYRHVIPHKAQELSMIRLPPLHIEGQASQRNIFSPKGSRAELNPNFFLTQLWKHAFSIAEFSKQVMVADSVKNHDTILALAQEVMLPKDVADLVEEGSEEIRKLLVIQQGQAKLDFEAVEKAKLELITIVKKRNASYAAITKARGEGATPPVVEPVDPSQAYSPLVLPSFNEEELLEEGADEVPEEAPEVACELSKEVAKAAEDSAVVVEENSVAAEGASPTCPLICNNNFSLTEQTSVL